MQSARRLLLILLAAITISITGLNYSARTAHSALFAGDQDNTAVENKPSKTVQSEGPKSDIYQDHFESISRVLGMIETGRETLHQIEKYEIEVRFELGQGSRFYPYRNLIVVDSDMGHFSAALSLIHEVTHVRYFHEKRTASIQSSGRQTYIDQRMEEEVNAVVSSIRARMELANVGVDITKLSSPLYYTYRQAYGAAVRAAKSGNPELDDETLQVTGHSAGQSFVYEALSNGQVVTSTTQQTYREYWGSVWDGNREQ